MVAALPTFRDGVVSAAADLNALVANVQNIYTVGMGGTSYTTKKPHLILRVTSTTRAVANSTDTTVTWDVADVNTDSMWSSGSVVTVNTAGTYRMSLLLGTDGAFGDGLTCYLLVNGTSTTTNGVGVWHDTKCYHGRAFATVSLAVGATVRAVINHTAGVSRNLATALGGCRLELSYIGAP